MKYYIISGEASGDLHASNLMKALKKEETHTDFRFWGGDLMEQVGGTMVKQYRERAFMGFAEVFMNLRTILNNIKFCKHFTIDIGSGKFTNAAVLKLFGFTYNEGFVFIFI